MTVRIATYRNEESFIFSSDATACRTKQAQFKIRLVLILWFTINTFFLAPK
jgi:hypothetical protein